MRICVMRTSTRWLLRGSAIAAALLATVQPLLGSFAFFRSGDRVDYETIHLVVGGILYNVAILLAVLRPRASRCAQRGVGASAGTEEDEPAMAPPPCSRWTCSERSFHTCPDEVGGIVRFPQFIW